jgi:tetratricopeptide (TPR) repeat protein
VLTAWQGDYAAAHARFEQSLAIRGELGDRRGIAWSLNNLGSVATEWGDYGAARALFEETLEDFRELGDRQGIAASLNYLGVVPTEQGDYAAARALFGESLGSSGSTVTGGAFPGRWATLEAWPRTSAITPPPGPSTRKACRSVPTWAIAEVLPSPWRDWLSWKRLGAALTERAAYGAQRSGCERRSDLRYR